MPQWAGKVPGLNQWSGYLQGNRRKGNDYLKSHKSHNYKGISLDPLDATQTNKAKVTNLICILFNMQIGNIQKRRETRNIIQIVLDLWPSSRAEIQSLSNVVVRGTPHVTGPNFMAVFLNFIYGDHFHDEVNRWDH